MKITAKVVVIRVTDLFLNDGDRLCIFEWMMLWRSTFIYKSSTSRPLPA